MNLTEKPDWFLERNPNGQTPVLERNGHVSLYQWSALIVARLTKRQGLKTILFLFLPPANEVCEGYVFKRVCLSTGGKGSTWAGTHPPGRYTHDQQVHTPPTGTPPPPGQVHPPRQVHPRADTPPGRYTVPPAVAVHAWRYGQQADGTHPTGIQFTVQKDELSHIQWRIWGASLTPLSQSNSFNFSAISTKIMPNNWLAIPFPVGLWEICDWYFFQR